MNSNLPAADAQRRRRTTLIVVALVFAAPLLIAFALSLTGWRPKAARNNGELIEPPVAFADVVATTADGGTVDWNTADGFWHVLVLPPPSCGTPCATFADVLRRVHVGLGGKAARVRVLWIAEASPDATAALAAFPQMRRATLTGSAVPASPVTGIATYLVDPNGYLVLRYAPGFNPVGLRSDLKRLLR